MAIRIPPGLTPVQEVLLRYGLMVQRAETDIARNVRRFAVWSPDVDGGPFPPGQEQWLTASSVEGLEVQLKMLGYVTC